MSKSIKIFQFRSFLFSQNLIRDMKLSQAEDVGRLREQFEEKVRELEKRYSNRYNSLRTGLILCKKIPDTKLSILWRTFMGSLSMHLYGFHLIRTISVPDCANVELYKFNSTIFRQNVFDYSHWPISVEWYFIYVSLDVIYSKIDA